MVVGRGVKLGIKVIVSGDRERFRISPQNSFTLPPGNRPLHGEDDYMICWVSGGLEGFG
jgi:hypothetical protein